MRSYDWRNQAIALRTPGCECNRIFQQLSPYHSYSTFSHQCEGRAKRISCPGRAWSAALPHLFSATTPWLNTSAKRYTSISYSPVDVSLVFIGRQSTSPKPEITKDCCSCGIGKTAIPSEVVIRAITGLPIALSPSQSPTLCCFNACPLRPSTSLTVICCAVADRDRSSASNEPAICKSGLESRPSTHRGGNTECKGHQQFTQLHRRWQHYCPINAITLRTRQ